MEAGEEPRRREGDSTTPGKIFGVELNVNASAD
jgi:hypothetical protein